MITTILRSVIVLAVLFAVMRLMGKKTLGEMQPYEFVITLAIAELACIPMADPAVPLLYGIVPLLTVFALHYLLALCSRKSLRFRKLLDGSPIIVITPDGVDHNALAKLNMTVDDLLEATSAQGYFALEDVYMAYFQTNGSLTVLPTAAATPPTLGDLGIRARQTTYALPFVEDGKPCNLDRLGLDERAVVQVLKDCGVDDPKQVVVATADRAGSVYLKTRSAPYSVHTVARLARRENDYA